MAVPNEKLRRRLYQFQVLLTLWERRADLDENDREAIGALLMVARHRLLKQLTKLEVGEY